MVGHGEGYRQAGQKGTVITLFAQGCWQVKGAPIGSWPGSLRDSMARAALCMGAGVRALRLGDPRQRVAIEVHCALRVSVPGGRPPLSSRPCRTPCRCERLLRVTSAECRLDARKSACAAFMGAGSSSSQTLGIPIERPTRSLMHQA